MLAIGRHRIHWSGTPLELYRVMAQSAGKTVGSRWPRTVSAFGNELRRIALELRPIGLVVNFERRGGERILTLKSEGNRLEPATG